MPVTKVREREIENKQSTGCYQVLRFRQKAKANGSQCKHTVHGSLCVQAAVTLQAEAHAVKLQAMALFAEVCSRLPG